MRFNVQANNFFEDSNGIGSKIKIFKIRVMFAKYMVQRFFLISLYFFSSNDRNIW